MERNLAALGDRSARAVAQVRAALAAEVAWVTAPDGAEAGSLRGRQLASLRAPLAEAEKLAASVDIANAACVVVRGFGLGHHVATLARRLKAHGAVIAFEPDVSLLRAVFEKIDCTAWLRTSNIAIITDAEDTGAIAAATSGIEAILAAGTVLVDHPASRVRLGVLGERFGEQFTTVMKAVRTNVVTTLVQVDVTVKNLLSNLAWYATVPGIADLTGACKGKPAVVVSAGPSLRRNVDLLSRPGVRGRVVIIAVQTVLKTLLSKGIKPHFVTALDYHEISRRFYEGLTTSDVEGVTLVAEPKCSRAILEAFPGAVRCVGDHVLDQVLGPALARPMGEMQPGATVAHLAYYLARHLGCDPVILIGQDLGFTDGQYYAPGAAIHQVWSSELNEFRTLEMMEWERIARMRSLLRHVTDQAGRPIYTDEQMSTYLVQFERDFLHDAARGLTTIDATEGGVLKRHTKVMRLEEALGAHAGAVTLPRNPATLGEERLKTVESRLTDLRQSTGQIRGLGIEAAALLSEMLEPQRDVARVNRLIERVDGLAQRAVGENAYWLVQYINQTGQFNRFRADRAIHIDPSISEMERQKKEIERDIVNVKWLADAAEHVGELLDGAGKELTRQPTTGESTCEATAVKVHASEPPQVWAVIAVDPDRGGLGTARDLARPFLLGMNPLQVVLARLASCQKLAGAVLMSADVNATRKIVGTPPKGLRVEFEEVDDPRLKARAKSVGVGRLWSRHCWRGGIANLSCFDEACNPAALAPIMEARGIDAAVVVGADWALVDPALVDRVITRHLERPEVNGLTFTQAPPGLGACLLSRRIMRELAVADSPLATIGGLLGYIPLAPQGDPIAKPACVTVEPHVRDLLARCIPDSERRRSGLAGAMTGLGMRALRATATELAAAVDARAGAPCFGIEVVQIEAPGGLGAWPTSSLGHLGEDIALTIVDDGSNWHETTAFIAAARRAGFAGVHVKTSLAGMEHARALAEAAPAAVSVVLDGVSDSPEVLSALEWMLSSRGRGLPAVWVVPRLVRRDAAYDRIEGFYGGWIMSAGACVIDPLPAPRDGERIEPLPVPASVLRRARAGTIIVAGDGAVLDGARAPLGRLTDEGLATILDRAGLTGGQAHPMSLAS